MKLKKKNKLLSTLIAFTMCISVFSGCKYRIILEEAETTTETTATAVVAEEVTTVTETETVTTTAETTTTNATTTKKKAEKLGKFKDVKLADHRLKWDKVEGATEYKVVANTKKFHSVGMHTDTTARNYSELPDEVFEHDLLYIRIIAMNDSDKINYDVYLDNTGEMPVLTSESEKISVTTENTDIVTSPYYPPIVTEAKTTQQEELNFDIAVNDDTSYNAKPVPVLKDVSYRTIMKYNYGTKNLKLGSNKCYALYDFSDIKEAGIGRDGTAHPARMCYGISAEVKDGKVYFKAYNDYPSEIKATVKSVKFLTDESTKDLKVTSKTMSIDCSDLKNGLYVIQIEFSTGKRPGIAVYVNNNDVYLCSLESMTNSEYNKFVERREKIYDLMDLYNVKTTNTVDTSNLCYPWNDKLGMNSDTKKWIALSNEIVEKDWSKSRKVFAFHEWMCENLAYDFYKVNVLHNTRAFYYEIFDGSLDIYTTRVGVCVDYANIFVTMCRAHDIPCITMETPGHTWNLVYINGVWIEIDMTMDVKNGVYGKDLTKWERPESPYCYDGYFDEFVNGGTAETLLDTLWDYDIIEFNKKVSATGGHDVDSVRLPD